MKFTIFLFLGVLIPFGSINAQNGKKTIQHVSNKVVTARILNPISPPGVYIADPEARQMPDGRVYIYGSRDELSDYWCSYSYNVLSSSNLIDWELDQNSFATKGIGKQTDYTSNILYAPDCIYKDGKYYLYYCLKGGGNKAEVEGMATSDSPYGPFKEGKKIKGAFGIDPSIFVDDDGQAYLFWGQGNAKGAKLSKDMMTIEGEIHEKIVTYDKHFFNEGSSVRKRNGIYYFVYPSHERHGRICPTLSYATSESPLGPYTYRGVIIDNFGSGKNLENNHGCITEINGKWYVFYHRPTHGTSTMRKACVEPITFNPDGTINEVEMTTQGIGAIIDPTLRMDAARACLMSGNVYVTDRRPENDLVVEYLSDIRDGDTATWKYFDFSNTKVTSFTCKTWGNNAEGTIEIHLDKADGELIGTCEMKEMKDSVAYSIHSRKIKAVSGKHAVVLVFKNNKEEEKNAILCNLDWFVFNK